MKNKRILSLLALITLATGCSSHQHVFSTEWTYDENCHWHIAICEHTDVTSNKTPHTFVDSSSPATYDYPEIITHTCSICGYSYQSEGEPRLVHNFSNEWSKSETHHWHACLDEGFEDLKADEETHLFKQWSTITEATDTTDGLETSTCSVCSYVGQRVVESNEKKTLKYLWIQKGNDSCTIKGVNSSYATDRIVIPDTYESLPIKYIDYNAFKNQSSIKSVKLGKNIYSIGNYAFNGCTNLTEIELNEGLSYIGTSSFESCSKIESIEIPSSVIEIGSKAFSNCKALTNVSIKNGALETIYSDTFAGSNKVSFSKLNNGLYLGNANNDHMVFYGIEDKTQTSFSISNGCSIISQNSLYDLSNIQELYIPASVSQMHRMMFSNCQSLERLTIPFVGYGLMNSSLLFHEIFDNFAVPASLYEVNVLDGNIGERAFANCSNLTSINIYSEIESIGYKAFENCTSLIRFIIPDSVKNVGDDAFHNCSRLYQIIVGKNVETFGGYSFNGCSRLFEVVNYSDLIFAKGSTNYGFVAYYAKNVINDLSNSKILIENGFVIYNDTSEKWLIESIEDVEEISIPNEITHIHKDSFDKKYNVKTVHVGSNVVKAEVGAFPSSLETLYWDSDNPYGQKDDHFYYSSIYGCTNLKSVILGNNVHTLGYAAFAGGNMSPANKINSIILPSSITTIGESAFYAWSSLNAVFYCGTAEEYSLIQINNENYHYNLATKYFYSESEPSVEGNYWHYINEKPVIW